MYLLELIDTSPRDDLPCLAGDPDLFFAERPDDLERPRRCASTARPGRVPGRGARAGRALGRLGRRDLRSRRRHRPEAAAGRPRKVAA